ncbi:MAG: hypothetical protein GEV28_08805 [Actinophytocola sp.]|uniref:hypothetical protein n=1 Tax=Actinophytocola sp. TaxID=1872138 RepID=UPI00132A6055|nr:hypothetical protein [Actinophytocola sp.]MPZ80477.1 hypothetical protein [Actinophytocola sp.]
MPVAFGVLGPVRVVLDGTQVKLGGLGSGARWECSRWSQAGSCRRTGSSRPLWGTAMPAGTGNAFQAVISRPRRALVDLAEVQSLLDDLGG